MWRNSNGLTLVCKTVHDLVPDSPSHLFSPVLTALQPHNSISPLNPLGLYWPQGLCSCGSFYLNAIPWILAYLDSAHNSGSSSNIASFPGYQGPASGSLQIRGHLHKMRWSLWHFFHQPCSAAESQACYRCRVEFKQLWSLVSWIHCSWPLESDSISNHYPPPPAAQTLWGCFHQYNMLMLKGSVWKMCLSGAVELFFGLPAVAERK